MWYVHCIPCSYAQIYIRETKRRLETRLKEHRTLREWDDAQVGCSRACVGELRPDLQEITVLQRTRAVGEGTFRWHPQRSTSTEMEDWKSLVARLLWWRGREGGEFLTDLWPPMTRTLSSGCKAPTNSTFTDSNIPIHALTTIRLFIKQ